MSFTFETLLPIFLLIALGWALRWRGIVPEDMWRGLELLGYWVFFPALLAETLIRSDIANLPLTGIAVTMIASFFTMALGLLAAGNSSWRGWRSRDHHSPRCSRAPPAGTVSSPCRFWPSSMAMKASPL
jgi:predicted permease